MIPFKRSFVALSLTTVLSVAGAQSSNSGSSGSVGFQTGSLTTTNNTSSTALASLVPVGGGLFAIGSSGSAAITQIAGAGAFTGPGTYVLTDADGNTVTVVVGADGTIESVAEGDAS